MLFVSLRYPRREYPILIRLATSNQVASSQFVRLFWKCPASRPRWSQHSITLIPPVIRRSALHSPSGLFLSG